MSHKSATYSRYSFSNWLKKGEKNHCCIQQCSVREQPYTSTHTHTEREQKCGAMAQKEREVTQKQRDDSQRHHLLETKEEEGRKKNIFAHTVRISTPSLDRGRNVTQVESQRGCTDIWSERVLLHKREETGKKKEGTHPIDGERQERKDKKRQQGKERKEGTTQKLGKQKTRR